jgi:hypothetical protein
LAVAGCATGPQHLSAKDFQRRYTVSQTHMMEQYSYRGETNGCVYMSRIHLPRFYYSKLKTQLCYTETNSLSADFLERIRGHNNATGSSGKSNVK